MRRFLVPLLLIAPLCAQTVPGASKPVCIHCGTPLPYGVHAASCPYHKAAPKAGTRPAGAKAALAGTLFQSLITTLFASDPETKAPAEQAAAEAAARAEEARKARDAEAQAAYLRMMASYKQLEGAQDTAFRDLGSGGLALKSLDDQALDARAPFDTAAAPTPFFGDTMPIQDIRFLANPGNDPRLVDLRQAKEWVAASLKQDAPKVEAALKPQARTPDCDRLARTLEGSVQQRTRFQKTVQSAQEQVEIWEAANRAALLKAAQDGMEALTGTVLDAASRRAEAAGRLERILDANAGKMTAQGLDVAEIRAKVQRLRRLSSAGELLDFTRTMGDWQGFLKDGLSALAAQMEGTNRDLEPLFADPRMKDYFGGDSPALHALLDLSRLAASNKVAGKWVARKIPVIAGVELAINETYDALGWYLSFRRIAESQAINGRVLAAAESIQQRIDGTLAALKDCPGSPRP